jgi:Zn-dependent hydrolases, including glyoxylases
MKISIKKVLIGVAILFGVFIVTIFGIGLKMKSEIKKIHVPETAKITNDVYVIKNSFVNMFLVKDNDCYVAVDAGADENVIRVEMAKLNIDTAKVEAVILTHGDGDHTGALNLFKKAKLYLAKEEEQMINGQTAKMFMIHNSISRKDYSLLDDNQEIKVGAVRVKCILTPGHTPGSMSYLINDSLLFVGDAFGLKNGALSKPNSFFSKDMKTAIKSFDKISNLPTAKYIFTAHTGFTNDYKRAIAGWETNQK